MNPVKMSQIAMGAALGCVPLLITWAMPLTYRSPYVIAYPAVILSAWLWETSGAVATALVAGLLIEHFIFATHHVQLSPTASGWNFRVVAFVLGSILAGTLTRRAARQKEVQVRLAAERQLALTLAEHQIVTERERNRDLAKENEVRVELALDGADLGTWEWDLRTDRSRWSPGFYRIHDLSPETQATYQLWRSRVDPEQINAVEAHLQQAVAEGISFATEYKVRHGNGSEQEKWIGVGGRIVEKEQDRPVVMAGYCVDVTGRKRTEAALMQTEKLAVAGRLAASIAHEINNPLEAAMNLVSLSKTNADAEHAGYLDEALVQLDRVATIAQQTLRFSRRPSTPTTCRLPQILDSVLVLLPPKLDLTGTEVSLEVRSDTAIPCVPGEVQQVLTNILNNAVDAMGTHGRLRIRISDSVRWCPSRRRGVRLTISDNGSGMSPETLRRMREPFFTTKAETGTGLGMWVTYELVARHEGTLSVRSNTTNQRHGTIFSLFLPERRSVVRDHAPGPGQTS